MALLRKKKNNALQILSSREFNTIFSQRENAKFWTSVAYVQANVKSKIGIGRRIHFLFLYDMELSHQENKNPNESHRKSVLQMSPKRGQPLKEYEDINFLEHQVEEFDHLDDQELCYQNCLRMGYYLQKVHGVEILKMKTEFTVDDDGVLWFTYAHDICARFKKSVVSNEQLRQLGILTEAHSQENYDAKQSNNKHLDLSRSYLDNPEIASEKMFTMMNGHYHDLKVKLGLIGKKDDKDDLLNDIPLEDQFPSVVIKHMNIQKNNKINQNKKYSIKSRAQIDAEKAQVQTYNKPQRGFKPSTINKEAKMLTNNLLGIDYKVLVGPEDAHFVRRTDPANMIDPSKETRLSKLYEPPLKSYEIPSNNPFCNKSFTIGHNFKNKRNLSGRAAHRSHKHTNDLDRSYQIDWTKVRIPL